MNIALLTAAGTGNRMRQDIPKQFLTINEKPVIIYTLEAFQRHPQIDAIAVVCLDGWIPMLKAYARQFNIEKLRYVIVGGANGQESIWNGLVELEKHFAPTDLVLIHDGNRPMVSHEIISDCICVANQYGNAIPAIPVTEAILKTDNGIDSLKSIPRDHLKRTQTPHTFKLGDICEMHRQALKAGITNTVASCTLAVELGRKVFFSLGAEKNFKLTTIEDIEMFKALLVQNRTEWLK